MKYIVIAEPEEKALITELFDLQPELRAYWADAELLVAGVGALNIMQSLRSLPLDAELLNVGYAGSANYPIGSWKCVTEVRLNHPNVSYPEPIYKLSNSQTLKPSNLTPPLGGGGASRCFTSVDFVLQSNETNCVFDMELAFICGLGFTSVTSYKKVSDNLSLHEYHTTCNPVK